MNTTTLPANAPLQHDQPRNLSQGSPAKLSQFYATVFPQIKHYIMRRRGNEADASDIFQEALLIWCKKAENPKLQLICKEETFLFAICKRLWLCELRNRINRKRILHTKYSQGDFQEDVESKFIVSERQALYKEKMGRLNSECKQVLELFFERKSMQEIADLLQLSSAGMAKKKKYLCKKQLEALIQSDRRYERSTVS